jgi:hypothetical protein
MNHHTPIAEIRSLALILLALFVAGSIGWMDAGFALGVALGGATMLGSFEIGNRMVVRLGQQVAEGLSPKAAGLVLFKLPVVGAVLWLLLTRFDPYGIVLGGSVVVLAIIGTAIVGLFRTTAMGEEV